MKRNILTVPVQRIENGSRTAVQDLLAVEEPLKIRLGERVVSITMRTPGHDFELATGFLFTEGILRGSHQIDSIDSLADNKVKIQLRSGIEVDFERLERNFYTSSSCGVCGKASIEAIQAQDCPTPPKNVPVIPASVIHRLPECLRSEQDVFDRTGGLHAAALFDIEGNLLSTREDVGRHNALDKLIGAEMLASRIPLNNRIVCVSGRTSFELVQKSLMAGVPILAAVGAPSSLAVDLALRFGMTLLGFVRGDRFNIYSGASRIQ